MTIDVYNTHIEVYPYIKGDIPVIEQMYTAQDKFSGNDFPCGYLIDGGKLYLPRGTSISKLEDVTGVKATYHGKSDEFDYMSKEHSSYYDPRNELQEQSIAFLEDRTNGNQLSLNLITGFGKGNPLSMKIPCPYAPSGYKRMGDIHPGDSVFGANGKPTKVLQVFPLGIQDIYRVYFSDGRYSDCTDEHLWNVFEDDKVVKTMTTLDLISLYKDRRFHVSLCKPVEYPHQDVVIDPYTMGAQLAPISDTAYIPREYMYTDSNNRMELLRGLLSIDSSKSFMQPDNIIYKTCSENLLPQIRELALGLGYIVDAGVFHGYCVIQLIKPDNAYIDIIDIKKVRKEEAQCILVDAPDHLYLAEDFIVTHNTYCVAAAVTKLSIKALIITPNDGLKLQWMYKTFRKMFDYQESDLCNISGSAVMNSIMEDKVEPADVYFVNHQTLQSFLSQNNGYQLQQFFKKIKVGIKVYDESHLDFGNILLMDFFSNTDRTWYLTATFDRSDKSESACFKRAFQNVIPFGEAESKAIKRKHIIYHTVNITSNISPRDRAILCAYPGFAQPIDTLIPLSTGGFKPLGELKIGDEIFTANGKPTKVTNIWEHPGEEAYEISFSDGRKSISSAQHLWYVKRLSWCYSDRMEALPLEKIMKDYKVHHPSQKDGKFGYNYKIPMNNVVQYPHREVPIDPYILGAFIGDGYCRDTYLNLSNIEGSPKEGIVRYIEHATGLRANYTKSSLGRCHFIKPDGHLMKTKEFFTGCTSELVNSIAQTKHIPDDYLYNDEESRWAILQGLMDTDGRIQIKQFPYVCYKTIEYTSTSKQLLSDIQQLCWSLGLGCGYYQDTRFEKYSQGYAGVLAIQIDNEITPKLFRYNSRKTERAQIVSTYKNFKDRSMTAIYDIKDLNRKVDMRCIEVDDPSHLYLTNDYIVTHNSAVKYGKYSLFMDKNDTVYRTILNILKKTENVEGKTLIFVPLIEGVDEIVKKLKRDFPQKSVTAYHSKIPKDEKEEGIVKKDIIVSTIKSCGTGKDIPGLRTLICAEPIASKVVTEQLLGRLREYAPDKDTYFWDIVDRSIPPLTWWHRSRIKKIESLAKQIVNLSM